MPICTLELSSGGLGAFFRQARSGVVCRRGGPVMAGAYSADLRERVLLVCERGRLSRAKVATLFQVAESTVYRWLQAWRTEGRREAKPHAGGPAPRLDQAALDKLQAIVAEAN